MKIAILTADSREHYNDYANPTPYFGTAPEALLEGFARIGGLEVHVISCTRQPVNAPEKIAGNIWYHNLHVPKNGWLRTLYQGCIRATRKKLKEIQPDIVHGQGTEHNNALGAVFSGFPNVITIHGNMKAIAELHHAKIGGYYWLSARLETFALWRTAGVFCNSAYTETLVAPRAKKIWRVPNPLRQGFFESIPKIPRRCVLLNVGVITERKRQLELLSVVENLHQRGLKFEFHFIGDAVVNDPYNVAFKKRLKPLEAAGCARYFGLMPLAEIIQRFDSASGFVHFPSEEAFGLVVAESMARGLKFFGARVGGIPDIAGNVNEAELFDADNFEGLTDAIANWIKQGNPSVPDAANLMQERYHPGVIAQRHLEIYHEVLNMRS